MKKLALLSLPLFIAACAGGGGGGSSSGSASTTPFTSWAAVAPNSTVQLSGGSTQYTYTSTAATLNGQSITGATVTVAENANNSPTSVAIQSAQGASVSINTANGDTITTSGGVLSGQSKDGKTQILGIQYDYQSFGVWNSGSGSGTVGAVTSGNATAVTSIPSTGSATFTGKSLGVYGSSGAGYFTVADMTANVNFANRSIAFATTNTVNTDTFAKIPGLNLGGSFAYNPGSGQFSGGVGSVSGMSGTGSGQFYGPAANEIGGTVALSGNNAVFTGSFGGKR
jgi:hypothetical protein